MALLEIRNLVKRFPIRKGILNRVVGHVHAVNDVSFEVEAGEKVGLVGESGCGKSTLGKTIARLWEPSGGDILFQGTNISHFSQPAMLPFRKRLQFIFQDPYGSLNPKMTVFRILSEPLRIHKLVGSSREERREAVAALLKEVNLPPDSIDKFPHEFSGGQRQRIGVARAIATQPALIIADEPVSALDVSVQAQIINLLDDLRSQREVTYIFISHDLKVVHHFCDRIMVMYLGNIVENISTEKLHEESLHPYTRALLSAIPNDDPFVEVERELLEGDVPSPIDLPKGCPFHTRCSLAVAECREKAPQLRDIKPGHSVACHFVEGPEGVDESVKHYEGNETHEDAHREFVERLERDALFQEQRKEVQEKANVAFSWGIVALAQLLLSRSLLPSYPGLSWLFYLLILTGPVAIWKSGVVNELVSSLKVGEDLLPQVRWVEGISWFCLASWTLYFMGFPSLWDLLSKLFGAL